MDLFCRFRADSYDFCLLTGQIYSINKDYDGDFSE